MQNTTTATTTTVIKKELPKSIEINEFKIPLIITPDFLNKVMYLHKEIQGLEWSGILFTKVTKGELGLFNPTNLNNIRDLEFTAVDFILMDIGTAGYTSFDIEPTDLLEIFDDKPELEDLEMGMLH